MEKLAHQQMRDKSKLRSRVASLLKHLSARCFPAAPSSSNGEVGGAFLVFFVAFDAPRDGGVGRALMGPPLLRHNKQFCAAPALLARLP
jgi:hypothetical protein